MSDVMINVENLSKVYRIGAKQEMHDTLRDAAVDFFKSRFKRLTGKSLLVDEDTVWALKDVSLEVKRGEVLGIIGRNGAGKSTLLKILSRITEPTEGRIELNGRVGSLLEVGTGFHPELTGRENIYLNGAILGMSKSEIASKFDEIVDFSEIEKFIDTPVKRYSSGMFVRLAFAVAAHLNPEILLVDEVLAVGDAEFQKKCLGKMGDVTKEGRTVLFVSHNMSAVAKLCGKTICLDHGKIVSVGESQETIQKYLAFVSNDTNSVTFDEEPSKDGQIEVLQIKDGHGNPCSEFDVNSSIIVFIQYAIRRPLGNHRVGVSVSSGDGTELFVTNSNDWGHQTGKVEAGRYVATLTIPGKFLASGRYILSTYLGEPNIKCHDRHENIMTFQISGNPFPINEKRRGYIIYPFEWNIFRT